MARMIPYDFENAASRLVDDNEVKRSKPQDWKYAKQKAIRAFENLNSLRVPRYLVEILGLNRAVFLANLFEKARGLDSPKGWLPRIVSEIRIETGLGGAAQRSALNRLKPLALVEEIRSRKKSENFYRINYEHLGEFLPEMAKGFPHDAKRGRRRKGWD